MYLRFIGKHGSMGLCNGKVYKVAVKTWLDYIWVVMPKSFGVWGCPYSSPQSFAANWERP